jgi:hypothetical protein
LADECRQFFGWYQFRVHLCLSIFEKFDKHPTTVAADVLARLAKPQKRHTNPHWSGPLYGEDAHQKNQEKTRQR